MKTASLSLFSSTCDAAQGKFLPHIAREESNQVVLPCSPESKNIVSCKNPDLDKFLEEIDGLDFGTVKGSPITLPIPRLVPILEKGLFKNLAEIIEYDVVGISLEDIFSSSPQRRGDQIYIPKLKIREDVLRNPIFNNKKVILFSSGRDVLIEKLWQDFRELNFAEVLSRMGVSAITGINFSVFLEDCPMGKAVNMKKSLKSVEYFQKAGIEVIPHVYFSHPHHLERWTEWLRENPAVGTVAMNCQFSRKKYVAQMAAEGVKFIADNVGREIRFLLEGPSRLLLREIHRLGYSRNIIIAIKEPSMESMFGVRSTIEDQKLVKQKTQGLTIDQLLTPNFRAYEEYVDRFIFGAAEVQIPKVLKTRRPSVFQIAEKIVKENRR